MCHGEAEGKMDVAMSSSLNIGKYSNKALRNFKRLSNIFKNAVIGLSKARHEGRHHVMSMIREMCN